MNEVLWTDDHWIYHSISGMEYDKNNPRSLLAVVKKSEYDKNPGEYFNEWNRLVDENREKRRQV